MLVLASAEAVAAITAGATLAAAVGIAVVTLRTTRLRLEHDRRLAGLDDLRGLLDEAAIALDQATAADLNDLRFTPVDERPGVVDGLDQKADPLDALHARLSVRLGPRDQITLSLGSAAACVRDIASQLPRMPVHPRGDEGPSAVEARDTMNRALEMLLESGESFVEAAVERAGTLPTVARSRG